MRVIQATCLLLTLLAAPSAVHAKNIVILMDGTWNNARRGNGALERIKSLWAENPLLTTDHANFPSSEGLPTNATNIARLFNLLEHNETQHVVYVRGVGTETGNIIAGGAFGNGGDKRIEVCVKLLNNKWKPDDDLCLIGFSRGAALARRLAVQLNEQGLRGHASVPVRFLGLFDTVESFGAPGLDRSSDEGFRKKFPLNYDKLEIPETTKVCVHLVAMDEDRAAFAPTLISKTPVCSEARKEMWFGGNHGDIGGGWDDEDNATYRRRQICLKWLLEQDHGMECIRNWDKHLDVKTSDENAGKRHTRDDYGRLSQKWSGQAIRKPNDAPRDPYPVPYRPPLNSKFVHESARR